MMTKEVYSKKEFEGTCKTILKHQMWF